MGEGWQKSPVMTSVRVPGGHYDNDEPISGLYGVVWSADDLWGSKGAVLTKHGL